MTPVLWFILSLVASFFASGTQTALLSLGRAERQRLGSSPLGRWFLDKTDRAAEVETTVLIANVATTLAVALAAQGVASHLSPEAWASLRWPLPAWLAAAAITPVLVLLAEAAARAVAFQYAPGWARVTLWPILFVYYAITPVRRLVHWTSSGIARLLGAREEFGSEEEREAEIMSLLEQGAVAGSVAEREREIVEAVFDFGELTVGRLMTPRPDMFSISLDMPWNEILSICKDAGYSRVPVQARRSDEVIGVLLIKDLLKFSTQPPPGPQQMRALLLPPTWVPQTKPANAMLREFLASKQHMAFVVDEHGTLAGLITLDDLLSELVGEFLDQGDEPDETPLTLLPSGCYKVQAWMDVDDFVEGTGIEVPRDGYNTIGGFVFHVLGKLPQKGDIIQHEQHRFTVSQMEGRRIAEVTVQPSADSSPPTDESVGTDTEVAP